MTVSREFSDKPLVSLDPLKLLGLRQFVRVSVGGASHDPLGANGAEAGRLLSKVGEELTPSRQASRVLSKVGGEVPPDPPARVSRVLSKVGEIEASRLLSKIGSETTDSMMTHPSKRQASRLLSKVGTENCT
jgi:hypothetical protein